MLKEVISSCSGTEADSIFEDVEVGDSKPAVALKVWYGVGKL